MPTTNNTFSVRNGLSVANTIVISNTSGIINVSNITLANITSGNIGTEGTYANGTQIIGGIANLNFNNNASFTWFITANGSTQTNITASPPINQIWYSQYNGV